MKNATKYQKKIKQFLSGMNKSATPAPPVGQDPFAVMVQAILDADAPKQAAKAFDVLTKEYVDLNELRVSPVKEIADTLGRDFPEARRKAEEITSVMNAIFTSRNNLKLDYVEKMPKRDLRRHLQELGLSPFAAAVMMMQLFGGHAIPVDQGLVDCLEADEYIEPDSTIEDVQAFLERIILQKQAQAAHEFFRKYVVKNEKMLTKKRKAAEAKAAAEADAEAAKAQAKAEAKAAAEARKAQADAKTKKSKTRKQAGVKPKKKTPTQKKTAEDTTKQVAKKAVKKVVKKTTKKVAKKTSRKAKDK